MIYQGSCHCGKIKFEAEGDLTNATACNCSICSRKGSLMWFISRDKLRLLTPEEDVATYTFNQHEIKHRFCPTCGMHPYGEKIDAKGNPVVAINIRCLENVDFASLPVNTYDGRSV